MTRLISVIVAAALASGCAVRTGAYIEPVTPVAYYAPAAYGASYGAYDAPYAATTWRAPYVDYARPVGFYPRPYIAPRAYVRVAPRAYGAAYVRVARGPGRRARW